MKKHYLLSLLLTIFCTSAIFAQIATDPNNILYVDKDATGDGSGSSWVNALPELADALKWAKQNENSWSEASPLQIWVAGGTYKPLYSPGVHPTDIFGGTKDFTFANVGRDNAFRLVYHVQLYGGFAGTETTLSDRDLSLTANTTILSGDVNGDDIITGSGANLSITGNTENNYHVVVASGHSTISSQGILNGFTITGGNADGIGSLETEKGSASIGVVYRYRGGGIYNHAFAHTLTNVTISGNSATTNGGGIYNELRRTTLTNVTVSRNYASEGGGIHNHRVSPIITNANISGNNSNSGGGISNYEGSAKFTNLIISGNNAINSGGGVKNHNSSASFTNVTISGNSATNNAGGIYNSSFNVPTFTNMIVLDNTANVNSGINENNDADPPTIKYSLVQGMAADATNNNLDGTTITAAEVFTDVANGDYSLKARVAVVNTGDNTSYINTGGDLTNDTDLAGNPRLYESTIDMGAYESQTLVHPPFKITQIQPLNGAPGTSIIIYGVGFDATASDNTVTFTPAGGGTGTTATVTGGTATQLSVTVPSVTGGNYMVSVQRASNSGTQTSQELFSVATGGGYFGATVGDSERIVSTNSGYAESVYAADVNGDGDMDLVFASQTNYKIAWYENDGNESFTERIVSTNAGNARSVHAADVDGDGDIDLMSASENDDKIAWYENDGSESFTEHVVSTTADGAFDVFAADMDGDGDLDLMSASIYDDKIAWYENDGSESFTEHVVSTNADFATSVHAADVDGDGDIDLMSASGNDDKIAWYENDGSESFTEHVVSTTAIITHSVYAADVDGDGDLDLMSASVNGNKIVWYENDGSESFTERIVSTTADGAYSVYAADMDGDGDIDLMSASQRDDKIAWYENDGSESFTEHVVSTTADRVHSVYAADLDGDGDLDLMSTSIYDGKIAWYENNSSPFKITQSQPLNSTSGKTITIYGVGFDATSSDYTVTFTPAGGGTGATATVTNETSTQLSVTVPSVTGGNYMISVKRDSDNYTDSLATFFTVISGGGDFGAAGSGEQVVSTAADGIQSVHAADVDGDGDMDLMSASENTDEIAWHENDGSQNFTKRVVSTDAFFARDVYAADVDGDGDMDILSASAADQKIAWFENDGATDPTFTEHVVTSSADGANSVFAIDVDGDGDTDLMTATSVDDEILWFENDGSQNFTEHVVSSTADGAFDVFAIDVDGDGDIDLLSASSEDDKIAWYENDGSQNFTERVVSTNANFPHTVFAADMDDDGDIDLLSASQSDDKIAWYKNDGSQNFTEIAVSTSGDRAISVYAADMDADGDLDIVSAFSGDDKITWYKNDGAANPSFTESIISNSADGALSIFVADVDNNGTLDVIAGSENDDKIAWYKNGSAISTAGRSLAFDGTGDFIEVADTNALDLTSSFTLEAWVKTSFGASAKHVIYKEDAYALTIQNTSISLNINDVDEYEFNYNFTPNTWVHVAVTFDPSKDATYFVNGKMIGYVTGSSTPNNSAHPLLLGGNSSSGSINGNLDEVRIWNEVRTITEIQTNMFQALSGNEDDLVTYFPFNEENGGKTTDQTSNSYLGTFNGNVTQSTDTHPYGAVITGTEGWRMMSAPVVNTSYGTLLDTLWTQGFTGADNANFSPNVLVWDETAKSFSAIDDATDIPGTASGFITFVYDDQDKNGVADGFPKLIQTDSTQFSGSISPSLTFTDSENLANDGWNLVGNPYGSTIDWDAASGLTSSNLDASFYVWSSSANSGSGSYLSWNGSTGTLSSGKISPWQGFWVKANATSPTLTLTNDARSSSGTFLKKKEIPVLTFTVKGNDLESSTIVSLQADASIDKDKYDAYKLGSLNETFLSLFTALGDGTTLDINALPIDLKDALSIPFDVDGSNLDGAFQLNWNTQSLPDEWTFTLINNMTGEEVNLLEESALDFELNTPAKEISAKENNSLMTPKHGIIQPNILKAKEVNASRFTLRIVPAGVSVNTENEIELPTSVELQQNYPNPFNPSTTIAFGLPESGKVTLEVFDVLGRKVATLLNGDNKSAGRYTVNFDASSLSSGMYIYRLQVGNSVITKKLTLIK